MDDPGVWGRVEPAGQVRAGRGVGVGRTSRFRSGFFDVLCVGAAVGPFPLFVESAMRVAGPIVGTMACCLMLLPPVAFGADVTASVTEAESALASARSALRTGRPDAGRVSQLLSSAVSSAESALASSPSAPERVRACRVRYLAQELGGQEALFEASYGLYLDAVETAEGRPKAELVVDLATERDLEGGRYGRVVRLSRVWMTRYPDSARKGWALVRSGKACLESGYAATSLGYFEGALALEADGGWKAWARRHAAQALLVQERYEESLAMLASLGRTHPTRHWQGYVAYREGYVYGAMGRLTEAVSAYRRCLTEYKDTPYAMLAKQLLPQEEARLEQDLVDEVLELK